LSTYSCFAHFVIDSRQPSQFATLRYTGTNLRYDVINCAKVTQFPDARFLETKCFLSNFTSCFKQFGETSPRRLVICDVWRSKLVKWLHQFML